MIDSNKKLAVLHDDDTIFIDYSLDAVDYIRDDFTMELSSTEDYLYLGFSKPFGACYLELVTPNVNANSLNAEYWDGASWAGLSIQDESKGFTRSGFIQWGKSLLQETTVDGQTKYFVRFRPSADHSATVVRGINIVFSDDNELKKEFFEITNSSLLPLNELSHITTHSAARDMIIQQLKNMGYVKEDSAGNYTGLTPWDLHDIQEVRQAATFLALSKIFFNLSDSTEDNWWRKYREYQDKFEESFRLARISLDLDGDGVASQDEVQAKRKSWRWSR